MSLESNVKKSKRLHDVLLTSSMSERKPRLGRATVADMVNFSSSTKMNARAMRSV
jgi:hypothetical protein